MDPLAEALFHGGNVLLGDPAAGHFVLEDEGLVGVFGQHVEAADDVGELARAAGLLLVPDVELGRLGGRLAVVDLRRADLDLDLELAADPLDVDLQVQLAHAGDDRLAGLFVGRRRAAWGPRGGIAAGPCPAGRRRRGWPGRWPS